MPTLNPNDYAYLWSPTRQILDKNGKPLVTGYVQLNQHGTPGIYAESYSDWNGSLNARNILLDGLGRATAIVENDKLYDMYVYNRYNVLEYSALGVNCSGEGGDSSMRFTSSDGSIIITRINNSVDLKVHSEESAYGTGTGSSVDSQGFIQFDNVDGNITLITASTLSLAASKVYHVTLQLDLSTTTTTDSYIDATINDSENGVHKFQIDGSKSHQYIDISWDLYATKSYARFYANLPESVSVTAATLYIHAVNSVTVSESGGGGGETYTAGNGINISPENVISADYTKVQPKLVAGENITIDPLTNTISASGGIFSQVQANWTETDTSDPSYIQNKPDLDQYAKTADLAPVALSNDYTDLDNRPSIPVVNDGTLTIQKNGTTIDTFSANSSSNKTVNISVPTKTSDLTNDSSFITSSDIPAQVQSDWNETDNTDPSYIQNKPSIPAAQVNSDWNASSGVAEILNKPSLATVATSGSYSDLTGTPTFVAGQNIVITESGSIITIGATIPGDTVFVEYGSNTYTNKQIRDMLKAGKLVIVYKTYSYYTTYAKPTFMYDIASDTGTVCFSAVEHPVGNPDGHLVSLIEYFSNNNGWSNDDYNVSQADWNATSGAAKILNKPNLAAVATSGSYNDLSNTPTIPTVDQTYNASSTNAQSGVAVASAISGKQDNISAGNMISISSNAVGVSTTAGITDIVKVQALPANPVATVLYLIEE